jgi:hypothetical protein
MMDMQPRGDFLARIQDRAASDPAFRSQLMKDPKGTLETLLAVKLPANMKVNVLQDSPSEINLVVPPSSDQPLSTQDLDAVSGGLCWSNCDIGP